MATNQGLSKRAALRQQQELEDRRKRTTRIIGFSLGIFGVAVVAILVFALVQNLAGQVAQTENQQTPPNATAAKGIALVSNDAEPAADAPHVVVYEDFQCPACAAREESYGPIFESLVDQGEISIEYRFATFMETRAGNDSSTRAAQATSAADAVGKFREIHSIIFANQSASGAGYSDQQLRVDFPAQAGITGEDLTTYQELFDTRAFAQFVEDSNSEFESSPASSTPTYMIGDQILEFFDQNTQTILIQPTEADVMRAISEIA